ncbi:MAG: D-alanyl-D-alanine carboxypeptidase, partial [Phormidesmis sp.]
SYTISDIFPVTGADGGTVSNRGLPANSVVKTGSLAVVSALAGVVPTEERGLVWFSLMNYGAGLDALRSRQDQIISALEQQWGKASGIPPELKTTVVIGQTPYQFGNPERNFSMLNQ